VEGIPGRHNPKTETSKKSLAKGGKSRRRIPGCNNPKTETSIIKLQDPEAETGRIA
jgi:hypothetical protein